MNDTPPPLHSTTPADDARPLVPFKERVRRYEQRLIERALKQAEGSVTGAARLLGLSYQVLAYLLKTRHKQLMNMRRPPVPRKRSIIKKRG